jgi:hypothetical protein
MKWIMKNLLNGLSAFFLALWPLVASGQPSVVGPLQGGEFEAAVTGRTFAYEVEGETYGMERYLSGRRVIWAFSGAPCREGVWHEPVAGLICFVYEGEPEQHCWTFRPSAGSGLRADFLGSGATGPDGQPGNDLPVLARPTSEPMICPGPDVGV